MFDAAWMSHSPIHALHGWHALRAKDWTSIFTHWKSHCGLTLAQRL